MSVYTFVCAHFYLFHSLSFEFGSSDHGGFRSEDQHLASWTQTAASVVPIWRPQAQIQEIQESWGLGLSPEVGNMDVLVQRQEEFPLVCGKFCLDLQLIGWGSYTGEGNLLSSGHYFKNQSHPKHPTPSQTSRIKCDQVTGHSITLIHEINITVCVCLVCLCLKYLSAQILFTKNAILP